MYCNLRCLLLFIFLFSIKPFNLSAQEFTLKGALVEEETKEALSYAHVLLLHNLDSSQLYLTTDLDGQFQFNNLREGNYHLTITYVGYEPLIKDVVIQNQNIDLGNLVMHFQSETLTQIEVQAIQIRAVQLGDTTQFNAAAYKTNPDATAEDLINKMPGFVKRDGQLESEGEAVVKVLVDGKPFFGDDPNMALKNLPAQVISKIQVFDGENETSQATGFSDGNTEKTINIILKEDFKKGSFGNVYAGYGYKNKFQVGGNINYFNGDRRLTVIGQSNNINIQNFSSIDLAGISAVKQSGRGGRGGNGSFGGSTSDFLVSQRDGINSTNAFGINYQDKWGEKVDFIGSYFFNYTKNENDYYTREDYFNTEFPYVYENSENSLSKDFNHNFNMQLKYTIDERNTILFRPSFTIQQNSGNINGLATSFVNDAVSNTLNQIINSDFDAFSLRNRIMYTHKFEKKGRSLNINFENTWDRSTGDKLLNSTSVQTNDTTNYNQLSDLKNKNIGWTVRLNYTEPLNEKNSLLLGYKIGNEINNYEVYTNDIDSITNENLALNDDLSNVFTNHYLSQNVDLGYRFQTKKLNFMLRGSLQIAQLNNEQLYPSNTEINKSFINLLPMAMLRYKINEQKNIRLYYSSRTSIPNVKDLQNLIDISNPLQIKVGNPSLDQAISHRISLRYAASNLEKGTVFSANLRSSFTQNYIANSTEFVSTQDTLAGVPISEGSQIISKENLKGYLNSALYISYGMPFKALKSNLNFDFGGSYTKKPSLVNDLVLNTHTESVNLGVSLTSNISENIDFSIGTRSSVQFAQSSSDNNSNLFRQSTTVKLDYIFLKYWKISTDFSHSYYNTQSTTLDKHYLLWNANFGRKFLKDNRAEISLGVYDIFNTSSSLSETYTENAYIQTESTSLNRFVMLNFKYNIRAF